MFYKSLLKSLIEVLTHLLTKCLLFIFRIPTVGSGVPRLLKYMTMMVALTAIVLIESIFLKVFVQSKENPPEWMKNFSKFLATNPVSKYFVFAPFDPIEIEGAAVQEDVNNEANPEAAKVNDTSKYSGAVFCRFVDRILFFILIVCYAVYNGY